MQKCIKKLFLSVLLSVILFTSAMTVNALTIRETVNPNDKFDTIADGTIVMGITKFGPEVVITALRASKATFNDVIYHYGTPGYNGVNIFYYLLGDWYSIDENNKANPITDERILQALNNLDIFYINNTEKILEIPYSTIVEEGYELEIETDIPDKNDEVIIENGKILVPATINRVDIYLKNLSDGTRMKIDSFAKSKPEDVEFNHSTIEGTISKGDSTGGNLNYIQEESTITIDGEIEWYQADPNAQNGRPSGNYASVKITAPTIYSLEELKENATVKIDNRAIISWDDVIDETIGEDRYFIYYPRFDADTRSHTITIKWAEGNTQVFTILLAETATLENSPKGTISTANTTSPNAIGTVSGNDIVFDGEIKWFPKDESVNRTSPAHLTDVKFTAPVGYTEDYLLDNATVKIDDRDPYTWDEVTEWENEDTFFVYYPRFDSLSDTHTVTITWENGNVQVFTISLSDTAVLEDYPQGTISTNNTTSPDAIGTVTGNDIEFDGEIKWYPKDESVNRLEAAHLVDVKFTAPSGYTEDYLIDNATVKIDDRDPYTWDEVTEWENEDTFFVYYPKFDSITDTHTVTITWEEGNTQVFTISLSDTAVLGDYPQGTISTENIASPDAIGVIDGNNINFVGKLTLYRTELEEPAYLADVMFTAPSDYSEAFLNEYASVEFDGIAVVSWDDITNESLGEGRYFTYYPEFSEDVRFHTIEITWEEGNTQTFIISIDDDIVFEDYPQGSINTSNETSPDAIGTVTGNDIVFNGEIKYYPVDESVNRLEAAHLVDVIFTAPTGYTEDYLLDNATVRIDDRDPYTWDQVTEWENEDTFFVYYPRFDSLDETHTVIITWETGNTQVFTISLGESAVLGDYPQGTIDTSNETSPDAIGTVTGNDIVFNGEIKYYPVDESVNRTEAAHLVDVIFTAPEDYSESFLLDNTTVQIDDRDPYTWDQVTEWENEDTFFVYYPRFDSLDETHTVMITWEEGNTQVFTISLGESAVLEDCPHGTISSNNELSPDAVGTANGNTITFDGEIKLYRESGESGTLVNHHLVDVEITGPSDYTNEYLNEHSKVKVDDKAIVNWVDLAEDNVIALILNFSEEVDSHTITITWDHGNTEVFTVNLDDTATLEGMPQGSISSDNTTSPNAVGEVDGNEIMFDGEIKWYPKDDSVNRLAPANLVDVKFTAPAGYTEEYLKANTTVTIDDRTPYTWDEVTQWENEDTFFVYYPRFDSVDETHTVIITWEEGNTQVFSIYLSNDSTLGEAPKGTISSSNTTSPDAIGTVTGNDIEFDGEIKWYPKDESVNRLEAAHLVDVKFTAPSGYTEDYLLDNATVKIDNRDPYTWDEVTEWENEDTFFVYYPKFDSITDTHTVTITWEEGNTQVFTISLDSDAVLGDYPKGIISSSNTTSPDAIGTVTGNDIEFNGTIKWFSKDESVNRLTPAHLTDVKFTAPSDYSEAFLLANTTVKIDDRDPYTWDEVTEWENEDTFFVYYPKFDSITDTHTVTITWEEGNTQVFIISLNSNAVLEGLPSGSISSTNSVSPDAEGEVDGNTITFDGTIKWYSKDEMAQHPNGAYLADIRITAPTGYTENYLNANTKVKIDNSVVLDWDDMTDDALNEFTHFGLNLEFSDEVTSHTITITWEEGNTQIFTISLSDTVILEGLPSGSISTNNTTSPNAVGNVTGNNIVFNGTIKWFPIDESVNRLEPTNLVDVKFTAPSKYDEDFLLANTTVKIDNRDPYTWDEVTEWENEDTFFVYYPKFENITDSHTVTIKWEDGNTEVFTISLTDNSTLEKPYGNISTSNTTSPDALGYIDGNDIEFDGDIKWYPKDESVNRFEAANLVDVKFTAPSGYTEEYLKSHTTVKIDDRDPYTWDEVTQWENEDTFFIYYPRFDSLSDTHIVTITWETGNTQVFTISLSDESSLVLPPQGAISSENTTSPQATHEVDGNNIVFDGKIKWFPADADVNRLDAANLVDVKFTAPSEYNEAFLLANTTVKIDNRAPYTWDEVTEWENEDTFFVYYPRFDSITDTHTVTITWEEGNTQVFTISLENTAIIESVPQGSISSSNSTSPEATHEVDGNTITFDGELKWFPIDESVNRLAPAHLVDVKFTAPVGYTEDYLLDNATVKIDNRDPYTWDEVTEWENEDTFFVYYPKFESITDTHTVTIKWEDGNTQIFTIALKNTVTFEGLPQGEVSTDKVASPDAEEEVVGSTITFDGIIKWFPADEEAGRDESTHMTDVKFTAPSDYSKSYLDAHATVKIDNKAIVNWSDIADDTYFVYNPQFDSLTDTHTVTIKWTEGNTQVFTISLANTAILEVLKGTISSNNTTSPQATNEVDENDIVFSGTIKWFPKDTSVNRTSPANLVDVKFTAPSGYTEDYLLDNATVKIDNRDPYTWDQVTEWENEDTFFVYYPKFDSITDTHTVTITWEEGNTQVFTISLDSSATLQTPPNGTISTSNTTSPNAVGTATGNNIVFNGTIKWFAKDESVNRIEAANLVDVKFTAPSGYTEDYLLDNATVKIDDRTPYTWDEVTEWANEDTFFVYYPKFDSITDTHTVTITWEEGNTQIFNISLSNTSTLQLPQGTISTSNTTSPSATGVVNENSIVFNGQIKWFDVDTDGNRTVAGNLADVKFSAPEEYDEAFLLANATVKIDDRTPYTWDEVTQWANEDTFFVYYPRFDSITDTHTVTITWEEGNTQVFTISLNSNATLEPRPQGTISSNNTTSPLASNAVNGNNIVFDGIIKWFRVDESVNRLEAANLVDVKFTAPSEYNEAFLLANATVKIDDRTPYTWDEVTEWENEDTFFVYYPKFDSLSDTHTVTIKWEEGNTQVFTISLKNSATIEIPPKGTISSAQSTSPLAPASVTGNNISFGGTIKWYDVDSTVGRVHAGNLTDVKFTAPSEYNETFLLANAKVKIDNRDYISWDDATQWENEDTYFVYYPRFDSITDTHTVTIKWEEGNTQVFTISLNNAVLEAKPQGTISSAQSTSPAAPASVSGNNISFGGTIKWYDVDSTVGRVHAGNLTDVKFTAPSEYNETFLLANAKVKIDNRDYISWDDATQWENEDTFFVYYPRFDSTTDTHTVTIKWEEGNTQVFTINLNNAVLEAKPQGSISTNNTTSPLAEGLVNGNNIVFSGTIKRYGIDESVNRLEAANLVDVKFTAPSQYDEAFLLANTYVTIDGRSPYTWDQVTEWANEDTFFVYYPKFDSISDTHTVTIKWEEGNTQVFTISLASGTIIESEEE